MKLKRFCFVFAIHLILFNQIVYSQEKTPSIHGLKGPYLGQDPPGNTAVLFAPGIVSIEETIDAGITFGPDGNELFFSRLILAERRAVILTAKTEGDTWTKPVIAAFCSEYSDREPAMSPDGKKLFFSSNRPLPGESDPDDENIWFVTRTESGWTEPKPLSDAINTKYREGKPSIDKYGNLYFHRVTENSYDIYTSRYENGIFSKAEPLSDIVNTPDHIEGEPAIDPEGRFLLFISAGRQDRIAKNENTCDLYITFRKPDNSWTRPVILGKEILSELEENWPGLSADGRFIFFSSNRNRNNHFPDIYWINADILNSLKPYDLKE